MLGSLLFLVGCGGEEPQPNYLAYAAADTVEVHVPEPFSQFCAPGQLRFARGERVPEPPPWLEDEAVPFQHFHYSGTGYIGAPVRCVVRHQDQWKELYPAIVGEPSLTPELVFDTQMLLVVGMGPQPTTGNGIRVTDVRRTPEGNLTVVVLNNLPAGDVAFLAETEPVHVVLVPRHDGSVHFIETTR